MLAVRLAFSGTQFHPVIHKPVVDAIILISSLDERQQIVNTVHIAR